jgi:hypothetical protein
MVIDQKYRQQLMAVFWACFVTISEGVFEHQLVGVQFSIVALTVR